MDEENKSNDSEVNITKSKKLNPILVVAVVLGVVIVGIFAVSMMGDKTKDSLKVVEEMKKDGQMEATSGSSGDSMTDATNAAVIAVEGGSFYYKPNVIRVKLGETVKIELSAVSMQHDFVIDELNVKSAVIPSGQKTVVEFVADTVGEFVFYCSVGKHREQGMVGTLIIEK